MWTQPSASRASVSLGIDPARAQPRASSLLGGHLSISHPFPWPTYHAGNAVQVDFSGLLTISGR